MYARGELHEAYEKLKVEGFFFDETLKNPISDVVSRIGIVTSQNVDVQRYILEVIDSLNTNC
jgi:exonuclease VII large subunit